MSDCIIYSLPYIQHNGDVSLEKLKPYIYKRKIIFVLAIKAHGEEEVWLHSFLKSTIDGSDMSASHDGHFTSRVIFPRIH